MAHKLLGRTADQRGTAAGSTLTTLGRLLIALTEARVSVHTMDTVRRREWALAWPQLEARLAVAGVPPLL